MKKVRIVVFGLAFIIFLCGSAGAALIDLENGIIYERLSSF